MNIKDLEKPLWYDLLLAPFIRLTPKFVKPNHVTVLRMLLTPVVLFLLYTEVYNVGVPLFLFVAFTDMFDGSLARARKQVTKWGIFYDPVADKILIGSVLLLIVIKYINPIIGLTLIVVELIIASAAWYKMTLGYELRPSIWGKLKMFLEVVAILSLLVSLWFGIDLFTEIAQGTLITAIIFAVVSLLAYSL